MSHQLTARYLLKDLSRACMLAAGVLACLLPLPGCVQVRHFNELTKTEPTGPSTLRLRPEPAGAATSGIPASGRTPRAPRTPLRPVVVPRLGEEVPARLAPAQRVPATPPELTPQEPAPPEPAPPEEDGEACPDGTCTLEHE